MADADSIPPLTRSEAKALSLTHYFTGVPCKHGHIARRYTSGGNCTKCLRLREQTEEHRAAVRSRPKPMYTAQQKLARLENRRAKKREKYPHILASDADKAARKRAMDDGELSYPSLRPCNAGHIGPRFTKTYQCVTCRKQALKRTPDDLARREEARAEKQRRREAFARANSSRQAALANGETQYIGRPCSNGHASGLRWTSSFGCVECGREQEFLLRKTEYDRAYRSVNHDRLTENRIEWGRKNVALVKATKRAYKARRRAVEVIGDPPSAFAAWEKAAKKVCYWCGCKCAKNYHVDHYKPLARGGEHTLSNVVIACAPCNMHKKAKDPYEFAASLGKLF